MSEKTFHFDLVSAERAIFSDSVAMLIAKTQVGELGIMPGHAQLLAALKPADLIIQLSSGEEKIFYVSGGILEVQPKQVVVLSDTVVRAEDLDEATILEAKQRAESLVSENRGGLEYAKALMELAQAAAQLQALDRLRKKK